MFKFLSCCKATSVKPNTVHYIDVRDNARILELRINDIEKTIERLIAEAKVFRLAGDQQRALRSMNTVAEYRKQRERLLAALSNMEHTAMTTECSSTNQQVVDAVEGARATLAEENERNETAEADTEALQEELEKQREVNDILGTPLAPTADEGPLMAELDALVAAEERGVVPLKPQRKVRQRKDEVREPQVCVSAQVVRSQ